MLKRTHLVGLNYKTIPIFPVPIHKFDIGGFDQIKNKLIDYAYDFKKREPEGVIISNQGGWQSASFPVNNEDDLLQSFIKDCLVGFPVIDKSVNVKVDAWININKPGAYNIKHNHPVSDLAGVLWIKCPKNSGNILFDNPTSFQSTNEIDSYTAEFKEKFNLYKSYFFPPTEGRILIFPSHLLHIVEENNSNEDRISVSFNMRFE